jgi:uncharacterized protein YukE
VNATIDTSAELGGPREEDQQPEVVAPDSQSPDRPTRELLVEITVTTDAVRDKSWQSGEITGSNASLDTLGSTANPLTELAGSGLGWLTPLVSFLEEPLNQLRGDPSPVSSGAQGCGDAGRDVTSTADSLRQSSTKETDEWSGQAASGYQKSSSEYADGLAALGESATTVATAIAGAGEVVAQVVDIVTRLVAEAIGKIIPIMTKAVAEAPATFGASIAAAIPQCVQIAVDYGQQILGKLAALVSSGENLLKLVTGAVAVMQLVTTALSGISGKSTAAS